ncbi:MAG: ATP-binding protein [Candidatus Methanoplasma sp.]|jgi:predicted AAA+ superfamily ATPase|nr:ATP-binding protein [Candidatus Methanoplasma sp.]
MTRQIARKEYLDRLRSVKGLTDTIKIVTGIRRCGKTTVLMQFMDELRSEGVPDSDIVYMNFEVVGNEFEDYKAFHAEISKKLGGRRKYVFLDEVQAVKGWEKAVNSMRVEYECDIYVTGSNAFLLSSELSTLLVGRTFEVRMLPLSFKEFLEMNPHDGTYSGLEERYYQYARLGSMPMFDITMDQTLIREAVRNLVSRIITHDIAPRCEIRDMDAMNRILAYVVDNVGNMVSPASIAKELRMPNQKLVSTYLSLLERAYVICGVRRFDVAGKRLLKANGKYYCTDPGMRSALIGYERKDVGRVLENIVYVELVRRGYDVATGEIGGREVDFIAVKGSDTRHYRVTHTLIGTAEREYSGLRMIRDNHPKTIITADRTVSDGDNGIREQNYIDFLLEEW